MYFTATFIASLAITAHALATPHLASLQHRQQHSAVARARALGGPLAQSAANASVPKKQLKKRCQSRKKATLTPSSSQTPPAVPSPSSNAAPVNVGSEPSASSHAPAHKPSSSPKPSPQPTPQSPPPAQSPSPPPPSPTPPSQSPPSSSPGGGGSDVHSGDGTFYAPGLGACGIVNLSTDFIVAVSHTLFDTFPGYNGVNPNQNPICEKKITATYQGKSVTVTVTDRCVGCATADLDFSPAPFDVLADPSIGRLHNVQWTFD